jgi:ribosomal protein S18 acetylase RimI-like enzyme
MTDPKDFELVEANLRSAMQAFSHCHRTGESRESNGVLVVSCGYNYALFNSALLTRPVADDLPRRISVASDFFLPKNFGWAYWVCEDLLDNHTRRYVKSFFLNRAFRPVVDAPGMVSRFILPPRRRLPVLDYRRVEDSESRLAFSHLVSMVFNIEFDTSRNIYGGESLWKNGYQGYLGYAGPRPVSAAVVVAANKVAGLYSVATVPELQGLGYGEATVRHVIHRMQQDAGIECFVLQSTRAGLPLYRRLGFHSVTRFSLYQFHPK